MSTSITMVLLALNITITFFLVSTLLIAPITVDQIHMDDTALLANLGWRGVNGYSPVIDFPHFYGGFAEFAVTTSFVLFGVSFKAIDYAFLILFFIATSSSWMLYWRRLTIFETSLLTALAASLILSLDPIEGYERLQTAHSFVYNHVGIVLMLALTVFSCRELAGRRAELLSAVVAGAILYSLVLLKSTFGVIGISVILSCWVQKRWTSSVLVVVGATIAMIVLDPAMHKVLGSFKVLMESAPAAGSGGLEGRINVASLMVQTQAITIVIVLLLSGLLWRRTWWESLPLIISLLLCGLGYGAAMLTTGGSPELKLMPYAVVAALLLGKALTEGMLAADAGIGNPAIIRSVPIVIAYALVFPALMTSGISLKQSFKHADASLIESGPLSSYVVFDRLASSTQRTDLPIRDRLAVATAGSLARVRGGEVSDRDEYVILADGMGLLRQIDNVSAYGIISNGRMFDFTAPLQSKVVLSFPVWPMRASPELTTDEPLKPDVDFVMILDEIPALELVTGALQARMGQDFRPCRRSAFWTLFVRGGILDGFCETRL